MQQKDPHASHPTDLRGLGFLGFLLYPPARAGAGERYFRGSLTAGVATAALTVVAVLATLDPASVALRAGTGIAVASLLCVAALYGGYLLHGTRRGT